MSTTTPVAAKNSDIVSTTDESSSIDKPRHNPKKNPARKIAIRLLILIILLITWFVASDRYAPFSSSGAASSYVTQLSSQVSGQVTAVFVEDGDIVEANTPLFTLDQRPFELNVERAKANLARVMQSTKASVATIDAKQAAVSESRTNLENTRTSTNRIMALAKRNLVSKSDVDNAQAKLKSSQAQYERAQADLKSAIVDLGASDSTNINVQKAQLELEAALLDLEYSTVKAPTLGVVTNFNLAIGQYVSPNSPALTFIDGRGAWLTVDLRENQLGNVDKGDKVSILFDAEPGKLFDGHVTSIAWGIDSGSTTVKGLTQNKSSSQWFEPARTIPVYIQLDEGLNKWPEAVKAGGKVSAIVYAEGEDTIIAKVSYLFLKIRSYLSYLY